MNHIEEKIIQTIDEHREEIIALAKDIQSHPEPGFYEERTAAHVAAFLRGLGLRLNLLQGGLQLRGVAAEFDGKTLVAYCHGITSFRLSKCMSASNSAPRAVRCRVGLTRRRRLRPRLLACPLPRIRDGRSRTRESP